MEPGTTADIVTADEVVLNVGADEIVLTSEQLAKHLHLGVSTVCQYAADGVIPYLQLGRRRRFVLGDVLAALRERYGREVA